MTLTHSNVRVIGDNGDLLLVTGDEGITGAIYDRNTAQFSLEQDLQIFFKWATFDGVDGNPTLAEYLMRPKVD